MRPRFVDSGGTRYQEASDAYYRLIELVFPKVDEKTLSWAAQNKIGNLIPELGLFYPCGIFQAYYTGTPEQQLALSKLFLMVQAAIEAAHQSGIERGKSLLVQLARGAITAKQLNDHSLEAGE